MTGYTEISSVDEWKSVLEESKEKSILVFKHSTTCPVSARAYNEFTSFDSPVKTYLVKVIQNRAVSNEIEIDLGVKHESPQALLVSNGVVVWGATHWKITQSELANATESI